MITPAGRRGCSGLLALLTKRISAQGLRDRGLGIGDWVSQSPIPNPQSLQGSSPGHRHPAHPWALARLCVGQNLEVLARVHGLAEEIAGVEPAHAGLERGAR